MESTLTIRAETETDQAGIHALHSRAFGQKQEAILVEELRSEGFASISLVAEHAGQMAGHILFSPVRIVTEVQTIWGLALAPVAVEPDQQRCGIGSALIRAGLQLAEQNGEPFVLVLGEPAYYGRFGFTPELASLLSTPYAGPYFMALELTPGALAGVRGKVLYAEPFDRLE